MRFLLVLVLLAAAAGLVSAVNCKHARVQTPMSLTLKRGQAVTSFSTKFFWDSDIAGLGRKSIVITTVGPVFSTSVDMKMTLENCIDNGGTSVTLTATPTFTSKVVFPLTNVINSTYECTLTLVPVTAGKWVIPQNVAPSETLYVSTYYQTTLMEGPSDMGKLEFVTMTFLGQSTNNDNGYFGLPSSEITVQFTPTSTIVPANMPQVKIDHAFIRAGTAQVSISGCVPSQSAIVVAGAQTISFQVSGTLVGGAMCTVWMRPSVYTTWYVPTSYIDKVKVTTRSSASGTYTDVDSIGNAFDAPVYGVPTVKDVSMTSTPAVLSNGVTVLGMTFLATPVWDMSAIHASQGATVTISSTGDSIFGSTNYNMTISGCVPAAETLEVATAGTTISLNFYGTLTANTVCTITLTSNQGVVYPVNGIWHPLYAVSFSGPVSMQSNYNAFPAVGILGFTVTTDPVGPSTVYTRVNSITMTGTPVRALEATGVSAGIRLNFIADLADGNFVQNQKYLMDVSGCVTTAQTGLPSIYGNPASQLLFRLPLGVNVTATACTVKLYPDPTDTVAMIYTAANYYRVGLSIGKDITGSGSNNCRQYSNTLNLIGSNYIYKMTKLPTGGLVSGASLASVSLMLLAALAAVLALL